MKQVLGKSLLLSLMLLLQISLYAVPEVDMRNGYSLDDLSHIDSSRLQAFLKGTSDKPTKIVLIPGLFNNIGLKIESMGIWGNFVSYLEEKGLVKNKDFYILTYNTQEGPENTINQISKRLKNIIYEKNKTPNQIVIVGHSKGSLDSLLTLVDDMKRENKIVPHVKGTVFMSAPFNGTEIANMLYGSLFLRMIAASVLAITGGDLTCLKYLQKGQRKLYNFENKGFIDNFMSTIPTLSVSSYLESTQIKYMIPMWLYKKLGKTSGDIQTDGAILTSSGLALGGDYLVFKNVSHQDMIIDLEMKAYMDEIFSYLIYKTEVMAQ